MTNGLDGIRLVSIDKILSNARLGAVYADCEQGTDDWKNVRRGRISASCANNIVTTKGAPTTGQTRQNYLCDLIGELFDPRDENPEEFTSFAMRQGHEREPKAREMYERKTGNFVHEVGFVFANDSMRWGCSPDGLVPESNRGLEIKCPMRRQGIKVLLHGRMPSEYYIQVQFSMWVCGLDQWDFVLFNGNNTDIPSVIWTQDRDDKLCAAFDEHIPAFDEEVRKGYEKIREKYND